MLRRLKSDVGLELPEKTRQTVLMNISEKDKRVMQQFRAELTRLTRTQTDEARFQQQKLLLDMVNLDYYRKYASRLSILTLTTKYIRSGMAKKGPINEYLEDLLDSTDKKMIVFAFHMDMLNSIEETMKARDVSKEKKGKAHVNNRLDIELASLLRWNTYVLMEVQTHISGKIYAHSFKSRMATSELPS